MSRRRRRFFARILVLGIGAALLPACIDRPVSNGSAVIVMLDYSKTFAPYDETDVSALNQVAESITTAIQAGWLLQPVKVQWAAFGDQGLLPLSPCGPPKVFAQRLTSSSQDSPEAKASRNIDDFTKWLH